MALANLDKDNRGPSANYQQVKDMPVGQQLAKVFGYMLIGLGITTIVAVGVAALMYYVIFGNRTLEEVIAAFESGALDGAIIGYLVTFVVSLIGLLIMGFVLPITLRSDRVSAWPAFIIYSIFMGVMLSCFVLLVDLATLAEALGITLVSFALMFLIGRFSKVNLNPLGLVALGFLFVAVLITIFFGLFAWLNPTAFRIWDLVFCIIVAGIMMIVTAVDAYNIKKILERGQASRNVLLFCAYTLYSDFIVIFVRVLLVLLKAKNRN